MAFPRILLAVPLVAAGIFLPAANSDPPRPAAGVLGMRHEKFSADTVTVRCGDTLTMQNNSRWAHIIGPGQKGLLDPPSAQIPVPRRELTETGDVYTTGAWSTPGTFYLTCSVHPKMTVKVVVTDCCC
jgi:plastocyanin